MNSISSPTKSKWWERLKSLWPSIPLAAVMALPFQVKSCQLQEKIYQIQNTPRLSTELRPEAVYVGHIPSRVDEVVTIPITIHNNSNAVTLNMILNTLISDGTGREADLNEDLRKKGSSVNQRSRLGKYESWRLQPPIALSVMPNAREQYKAGQKRCKIKVQLNWEDVQGNRYSQVTLAELKHTEAIESYPEYFFWSQGPSYSSYGDRKERAELKKHWGLPFKS